MTDAKTLIQVARRLANVSENTEFEVRVVSGPSIVGQLSAIEESPEFLRVWEPSKTPHVVAVAHVVALSARPR